MKQLLKNKYNGIGFVFLVTVIIRVGFSFLGSFLLEYTNLSEGLLTTVGQVLYIIPGVVFLYSNRKEAKRILHLNRLEGPSILLLFVIGVLLVPVMAFINGISMLFTENATANTMSEIVGTYSYGGALFIMAIVPAMLEEFIYRGVFFGKLRQGGLLISVITSGILFGLMHMNLNQFCYAMIVGMIMAMIVEITGSLLSTVIIHFAINGSTTTLMYLLSATGVAEVGSAAGSEMPTAAILFAIVLYGAISVFAIAGIIALLYVICVKENRKQVFMGFNPFCKTVRRIPEKTEDIYSIPMIVGILICLVLIAYIAIR